MEVGSADTTVSDLDINISFLPRLGLEGLPLHVSDGVLIQAHPAMEGVVGG